MGKAGAGYSYNTGDGHNFYVYGNICFIVGMGFNTNHSWGNDGSYSGYTDIKFMAGFSNYYTALDIRFGTEGIDEFIEFGLMGNTANYNLDSGNWRFNVFGAKFSYAEGHWGFQGYSGELVGFGYNSHTGWGPTSQTLDRIGKAWASPCTAVGLVIGTGLTLYDLFNGDADLPYITYEYNSLNFITNLNLGGAITFGNTVIYAWGGKGPDNYAYAYGIYQKLGLHEKAHTYQYQLMGISFWFFWGFSGGPTSSNFLENAANNYATGVSSWWLW